MILEGIAERLGTGSTTRRLMDPVLFSKEDSMVPSHSIYDFRDLNVSPQVPCSSPVRVFRIPLGWNLFRLPLIALSILLAASAARATDVTTFHNDSARTGQNLQEAILTPANVNSSTFGKLFTDSLDGVVDAEPLYLSVCHDSWPGNAQRALRGHRKR